MQHIKALHLSFAAVVAIGLLTLPRMVTAQALAGSTDNAKAEFDVISVRPSPDTEQLRFDPVPDGYSARHTPLQWIVFAAFSSEPMSFWRPDRLRNAPAWVLNEPFDIEARVNEQTAAKFKAMDREEQMVVLRPMLRNFLENRCGLALHIEEGTSKAYALTANKKIKLTTSFQRHESNGWRISRRWRDHATFHRC